MNVAAYVVIYRLRRHDSKVDLEKDLALQSHKEKVNSKADSREE